MKELKEKKKENVELQNKYVDKMEELEEQMKDKNKDKNKEIQLRKYIEQVKWKYYKIN